MPLVHSTYVAPWLLRNGHLQTIYPAVCRRIDGVRYQRERLELSDGDFVDLDWSRASGRNAVLISHGLEGSSQGNYVKGMVRAFNRRGWDAAALNFRGPRFIYFAQDSYFYGRFYISDLIFLMNSFV